MRKNVDKKNGIPSTSFVYWLRLILFLTKKNTQSSARVGCYILLSCLKYLNNHNIVSID